MSIKTYRVNPKTKKVELISEREGSRSLKNCDWGFSGVGGKDIYEGVSSPIDGHVFTGKRDYEEYKVKNNLITKDW